MASSTSTSTFTDSQTTTASLLPLVQQQLIDCVGWSDIRSVTNHELPHLVGVRPLKVADAAEEAGGDDASTSTPEPQPGDGLIAVVQPGERCLIFPVASMHTTSPARLQAMHKLAADSNLPSVMAVVDECGTVGYIAFCTGLPQATRIVGTQSTKLLDTQILHKGAAASTVAVASEPS